MRMLIVGIGALGGTIAARAISAGLPVRLAARNAESAEVLRRSGLRVSGIGGEVEADIRVKHRTVSGGTIHRTGSHPTLYTPKMTDAHFIEPMPCLAVK